MNHVDVWQELIQWADDKVSNFSTTAPLTELSDFVSGGIKRCPTLRVADSSKPLPYGRYLVHAGPEGQYNIQLDVFSKDYEGLPHAHETWGAFWVLQGRLRVTDWAADRVHEPSHRVSQTILSAGSGGCFSPPVSDWHEVRVEEPCDQVISIHVYGKGFNLDRGLYRNAEGQVVRGPRGPLKMWRDLAGSFC